MSFRLSSFRTCCGVAAVAVCGLLLSGTRADGRQSGRPIEYSTPRGSAVSTNLHELTIRKDGLKELQEELYQPAPSFSIKGSLDGVAAPPFREPAPVIISNKRVKELLDRRKNWIFMQPEDLLSAPTVEEILKTPGYGKDGLEKQPVPALERYYERYVGKRPAASRLGEMQDDSLFGPAKKASPGDATAAHDDSDLPSGIKESAQALKKMFGLDNGGDLSTRGDLRSSFTDPFGLGGNTSSKEQVLEHRKLMDTYNSMVDPSWHPPTIPTAADQPFGLPVAAQPVKNPAAGLLGSSSLAPRRGLDAQVDVVSPMLGPAGLPDVNARALGQPRPAFGLPTVEPQKVVAPTFTAPRRAF